ncbi:hypothetical protein ANACOL_03391 [Anaerotruncus colihominis DSM 17241]|uniref:Uncharacterized protein n=1 Tax=Anaerotruncus colihominis DSM 17241 TaxID=445972 RepID=B0PF12_9FIRM|nr:hypothetical protein ANACOL_03391 [Anaerotruncus colihominis DSM 17241]
MCAAGNLHARICGHTLLEPVFTAGECWTDEGFCTRSRQIFAGGLPPGKKI